MATDVEGKIIKHTRIYIFNALTDLTDGNAQYIAEFADKNLAKHYVDYMLTRERYHGKGIAIVELPIDDTVDESTVLGVLSPLGEWMDWKTKD